MDLIIVESPHKAKTIEKFLKGKYKVEASKGHVRDLPTKRMGINFSKNFEPYYEINEDKKADIKRLAEKAAKADKVYLATDPDREGEAISWHLAEVLKLDESRMARIVFNEITEKAVKAALENPRSIDMDLVDAQQARRVLDRLVGYSISPSASLQLSDNLSAGRVQSVALEMVVDREREIAAFVPKEYWNITAFLEKTGFTPFKALLNDYKGKKFKPENKEQADAVLEAVKGKDFTVKNLKKSVTKSHAPAPFTTSTLQQDGSSKLSLTAPQVMQIAQHLYEGIETENGNLALITYMRTDSVRISKEAQDAALKMIRANYGEQYAPAKPNIYKTKANAQDAHEAIRPIDVTVTPDRVKGILDHQHYRLYKLIYERFVASQMAEAQYNSVSLDTVCADYGFKTTGKTLLFKGYLAVYDDSKKEEEDDGTGGGLLPELVEGETLKQNSIKAEQKFTKPPTRYTEATLIKAMEEKGIGRPSTYATIMNKLTEKKRSYVKKEGKFLVPNEISYRLIDFLVKFFPDIMDISFTAHMEDSLDDIGEGGKDWHKLIADFYRDFSVELEKSELTDVMCEKCGAPMRIKSGKFGSYYACSNYPNCENIKPVNEKVVIPTDIICEKCGGTMVEREGKYGRFLACSNYPKCKNSRPLDEKKSEVRCKKCGAQMVERDGQYGKYLLCPSCKTTESLAEKVGICPDCGAPTQKLTSKGGRVFFGCTRYPDCRFMSWEIPTGKKCPKCGKYLVSIKDTVCCSSKKCDYKEEKHESDG